jgi:hypothetical protein
MNLDSDLRDFFSDRQRLTQIDHLHRLLFQCLQTLESELPDMIRNAVDDIALKCSGAWKRRDDVLLTRNGKPMNYYTHIGLVCMRQGGKWPADLYVHFGSESNLFKEVPWVGVYTRDADETLFKQVQLALRPTLDNYKENGFRDSEPYPIFERTEDWPTKCAGNRINAGGSVIGLTRVLDEGKDGVVAWIRDRIERMLDALDSFEKKGGDPKSGTSGVRDK